MVISCRSWYGLPAFPLMAARCVRLLPTPFQTPFGSCKPSTTLTPLHFVQRSPLGRSVVTALEAQMDSVASPLDPDASDSGATSETSPSRRRQGAPNAAVL